MTANRIAQCAHTRNNGLPCRANCISNSQFCFFHDPRKDKERATARKIGGKKNAHQYAGVSSTPERPLKSAGDVAELLGVSIHELRRGKLDPKTANVLGYLAGVLLKAIEAGETEARLAALEDAVMRQRPTQPFGTEPEEQHFAPQPSEGTHNGREEETPLQN